jgi:hypothetical protein
MAEKGTPKREQIMNNNVPKVLRKEDQPLAQPKTYVSLRYLKAIQRVGS